MRDESVARCRDLAAEAPGEELRENVGGGEKFGGEGEPQMLPPQQHLEARRGCQSDGLSVPK